MRPVIDYDEEVTKEIRRALEQLKSATLTEDDIAQAKPNIDRVIALCNARYFDAYNHGHAALNRLILLDGEIANLLTPTVLKVIFNNGHANDFLLERRSHSSTNTYLRGAIQYAFESGLNALKFLVNNGSPLAGIAGLQAQQRSFEQHTIPVVVSILESSGITLPPETFKRISDQCSPQAQQLQAQYHSIKADVAHTAYPEQLLSVGYFTSDAMRTQACMGLLLVAERMGVGVTMTGTELVAVPVNPSVTNPIDDKTYESIVSCAQHQNRFDLNCTLDAFCENFLTNPGVYLDQNASHYFYDKAHFLAALSDKKYEFNFADGPKTLTDVFDRIVEKMSDPTAQYDLEVKQQIALRMNLAGAHIKAVTTTAQSGAVAFPPPPPPVQLTVPPPPPGPPPPPPPPVQLTVPPPPPGPPPAFIPPPPLDPPPVSEAQNMAQPPASQPVAAQQLKVDYRLLVSWCSNPFANANFLDLVCCAAETAGWDFNRTASNPAMENDRLTIVNFRKEHTKQGNLPRVDYVKLASIKDDTLFTAVVRQAIIQEEHRFDPVNNNKRVEDERQKIIRRGLFELGIVFPGGAWITPSPMLAQNPFSSRNFHEEMSKHNQSNFTSCRIPEDRVKLMTAFIQQLAQDIANEHAATVSNKLQALCQLTVGMLSQTQGKELEFFGTIPKKTVSLFSSPYPYADALKEIKEKVLDLLSKAPTGTLTQSDLDHAKKVLEERKTTSAKTPSSLSDKHYTRHSAALVAAKQQP